jgi:hypothetical protein
VYSLRLILGAAVIFAAACTSSADRQRLASLEKEVGTLQNRVRALSYNTASGGGINVKMMPDPRTGQPTVPMEEQFSFDRNHAICRVETNRFAFKMPTYQMGEVVIQPHAFYMAMETTTIDQYEVTTESDRKRKVMMRGGLSCATAIDQANVKLGSRTAKEHATYLIEATDAGGGGGKVGDSFAFTVFFDPKEAPLNYKIFGPKFTFTGKMTEGEITIVDPSK